MNSPGLRERKKAATRRALHEAALRLAVERGLDNVTVEAIADSVDLSRRTFSNYFAGKEDAVLYGFEQGLGTLLELVRVRPAEEPTWTALRNAFHDLGPQYGERGPEWLTEIRLIRQHPSLLARQLAAIAHFERDLAQTIAERQADPMRARVMAATFLTGIRLGTQLWLDEPRTRPLTDVVDDVLDEMSAQFR
ncbi:TetR/AcrR family transcriptional regulator [Planosporangium mesophilum]|uniref:TetR family transcriptional regulator n=1 Tax=Planosporangium mesophilum TaxID=689768 RepID=A0A8J3TDD5_9ACTN|nr:TetR/AcrR family transcriptional regulator [Planosporangium mesophilum]NJC84412.1 TetR family transcriptional regulator [Planosporangium mesophilum]GII23446.1 TetR family transcriptional regulator [Planosporangium mesophilum]